MELGLVSAPTDLVNPENSKSKWLNITFIWFQFDLKVDRVIDMEK